MKFSTGLLVGAAIGGYVMYSMTPEQRDSVAAKASTAADKVRNSSAAESIAANVGDVAGAASERVADVVDSAGSTVSDAVAPDTAST